MPMTIELTVVLSAISLTFGIIGTVFGLRRNDRQDAEKDAAQLTTVIVKLENINDTTKEIRTDMKSLKADVQNHAERLARVEQKIEILSNEVFKKDGDIE